jgi:hypothetical protein
MTRIYLTEETIFLIETSSDSERILSKNSENHLCVGNKEKIDWNFLGTRILMKLGQQLPFYTLLQGKINSQQKRIRNLNSF